MFASYRNRWWIVIASIFGLMFVPGTINTFAFAVFLKPVSSDLGISRSVMASGPMVSMVVCGLVTPFMGLLIDRWGARNVLLPGIPLFALSVAAFAWLNDSLISMYLLLALAGLFGATQNTTPYASVISKWFDHQRGIALATAMTGVGLGIAIVPPLANLMIETAGWRIAYVGLGATIMLFAFFPMLLFVREPSATAGQPSSSRHETPGLTAAHVFTGEWRFWAMAAGFFLATISTHGVLAHLVAMLTDRGISVSQATAMLSVAGFGVIIGRFSCGLCLDRFHGPSVAVCFFTMPAVGIACLGSGATGVIAMTGTLLCGAGFGAQVGLMALFASRYFGLRAYGTVFGAMFGVFLMGNGVGPFLHALSFDLFHSYQPALIASGACLLAVSALFVPLGPYPFGVRDATVLTAPSPRTARPGFWPGSSSAILKP